MLLHIQEMSKQYDQDWTFQLLEGTAASPEFNVFFLCKMLFYNLRCHSGAVEGNNLPCKLQVIKYTYLQYKYVDVHG